jgi:hypothetical protein
MRYIVTRLFVRQAAIRERPVSRSVGTFVHSGSGALMPDGMRLTRGGRSLRGPNGLARHAAADRYSDIRQRVCAAMQLDSAYVLSKAVSDEHAARTMSDRELERC